MTLDITKIAGQAAEAEDLTQDKATGFPLPRAGVALLRFLSYVETGRHQPKNKTHKPALNAILTFELSHVDHIIEVDGKKVFPTIDIRIKKGSTSASGFRRLFNAMNKAHGGKATHFAQLIGKSFLGEVFHNKVGEGSDAKTYANLDSDKAWSLKAPVQVDALTGAETPIQIAELQREPKLFLWENEGVSDEDIKAMWDSIFIEGTKMVKEGDVEVEKSKNWLQEFIMTNLDWDGSRTQELTQEQISLDDLSTETPAEAQTGAALEV